MTEERMKKREGAAHVVVRLAETAVMFSCCYAMTSLDPLRIRKPDETDGDDKDDLTDEAPARTKQRLRKFLRRFRNELAFCGCTTLPLVVAYPHVPLHYIQVATGSVLALSHATVSKAVSVVRWPLICATEVGVLYTAMKYIQQSRQMVVKKGLCFYGDRLIFHKTGSHKYVHIPMGLQSCDAVVEFVSDSSTAFNVRDASQLKDECFVRWPTGEMYRVLYSDLYKDEEAAMRGEEATATPTPAEEAEGEKEGGEEETGKKEGTVMKVLDSRVGRVAVTVAVYTAVRSGVLTRLAKAIEPAAAYVSSRALPAILIAGSALGFYSHEWCRVIDWDQVRAVERAFNEERVRIITQEASERRQLAMRNTEETKRKTIETLFGHSENIIRRAYWRRLALKPIEKRVARNLSQAMKAQTEEIQSEEERAWKALLAKFRDQQPRGGGAYPRHDDRREEEERRRRMEEERQRKAEEEAQRREAERQREEEERREEERRRNEEQQEREEDEGSPKAHSPGTIGLELQAVHDISDPRNMSITGVTPAGPAEHAGLQRGDKILWVRPPSGQQLRISSAREFKDAIGPNKGVYAGSTVTVGFLRGNEEHETDVTLASRTAAMQRVLQRLKAHGTPREMFQDMDTKRILLHYAASERMLDDLSHAAKSVTTSPLNREDFCHVANAFFIDVIGCPELVTSDLLLEVFDGVAKGRDAVEIREIFPSFKKLVFGSLADMEAAIQDEY